MLGANGQLGREFHFLEKNFSNFKFTFLDRIACDITVSENIDDLKNFEPNIIINCAAYTAVDQAEDDEKNSFLINAVGPRHLAQFCAANKCLLVHYSSDYVYDSITDRPLKETDDTTPNGLYAKTKLQGDLFIAEYADQYLIFRTSWVYSSFGNNFVKTMLKLGKEGTVENPKKLNIVSDQIGAPSYARDLAFQTLKIIQNNCHDLNAIPSGIYNMCNRGQTNWADFAKKIFSLKNMEVEIKAIPSEEYPTPAKRPLWSMMNMNKLETQLSIKMPHWEESLEKCLQEIVD